MSAEAEAGSKGAEGGAEDSAVISKVVYEDDPVEINAQAEMVLFKFPDLKREDVKELQKQFETFFRPEQVKGEDATFEMEEDQVLRLLEARGETKTFREMREMFAEMDADGNHRLSFLEWCCAHYNKSWESLHTGATIDASKFREMAAEQAKIAQAKLDAIAAERAATEEEERRKKEEEEKAIEEEKKLTGVAGKAAFFKRQAAAQADTTETNEQRIKREAAQRRAEREARKEAEKAKHALEHSDEAALEEASKMEEERKAKFLADKERAEAEAAKKEADEKEALRLKREEFKRKQQALFEKNKS